MALQFRFDNSIIPDALSAKSYTYIPETLSLSPSLSFPLFLDDNLLPQQADFPPS
jgi:hypothetical protein